MMNFRGNPSYRHWNISNYILVLDNDNSNIVYLLTSILLTLTSTLTQYSLYQNSVVISSALNCESVWTLMVDILNTISNCDCFADCSLGLTLIVSFWKIAILVCRLLASSFSRMRVMNHNWSATKQRLHPQSVAEISRHLVSSGDRIRQCVAESK